MNETSLAGWKTYEPKGNKLGDMEIEYSTGQIEVFQNVKQIYDDTEGISFYHVIEGKYWVVQYISHDKIYKKQIIPNTQDLELKKDTKILI